MIMSDELFMIYFGYIPYEGGLWENWTLENVKYVGTIILFEYVG